MGSKQSVNLVLDSDVLDMLNKLAEGKSQQEQYISSLIRNAYAECQASPDVSTMDADTLRHMIQESASRVLVGAGETPSLLLQLAARVASQSD